MDSIKRVMTAIEHREPDRVPKGELGIAKVLTDALLGDRSAEDEKIDNFEREVAVRKLLNIDLVSIGDWGPNKEIGRNTSGQKVYRTAYGMEYTQPEASGRQIVRPAISDITDSDRYEVPDIKLIMAENLERYCKRTDLFVFGQICGPLDVIVNLVLGFENYMIYAATDTELLAGLSYKLAEFEIEKAKKFLKIGAHAIMLGDDIAYNTGLFISPDLMQKLEFPFWRQMIREIKLYRDVPVFLHTDGNINEVLDEIVDVGFDGIQSLQPSAGMDIALIKQKYGDRLCLMGNLDLDTLLPFGTPEEVARVTEETIRAAGLGGGYILSTCNVLTKDVPPANALAMYRTADRVGNYPIA